MKRDLLVSLSRWEKSPRRKPLILQGARQVGKTYLLKDFGRTHFEELAYFNFESDPALDELFHGRLTPSALIDRLSIQAGTRIRPGKTLIILDEIQLSPNALTSLKYFSEGAREFPVVAAGSLLGVKLSGAKSFPVGKVDFLHLHPLSFFEFLSAMGKSELRGFLESVRTPVPLPAPFHQECLDLLRIYFFLGGMPEVVSRYASDHDVSEARANQQAILRSYALDFSKYAAASDVMKITQIWDSVPGQLARESKKFVFSAVARSARSREYESALQWLLDAGFLLKSSRVEVPRLPLSGYADAGAFKLFHFDVGLLGAMARLDPRAVIEGDRLFTEFKGALTENFVARELTTAQSGPLYYWKSAGDAEVDFLLEEGREIIPLEVKSGPSAHSKSLKEYVRKFKPSVAARATPLNLIRQDDLVNFPLYLVCRWMALGSGRG